MMRSKASILACMGPYMDKTIFLSTLVFSNSIGGLFIHSLEKVAKMAAFAIPNSPLNPGEIDFDEKLSLVRQAVCLSLLKPSREDP
jgi:hypothetical protein